MGNKYEGRGAGGLLLPALFTVTFANWSPSVISGLLLLEIAESFGASVGVTGQMMTFSSVLGIFSAVLTGVLSVRYGPRTLLLSGLLLHVLSGVGCGLAPSLWFLFLAFSVSGFALAIVSPMVWTLVGEHLPTEKRPVATGWLIAAGTLTFLLGPPLVGYLETLGGWRLSFFAYHLPMVLLALLISYWGIPVSGGRPRSGSGALEGIRQVLSDRSALSCLVGIALTSATYYSIFVYSLSFFRVRFELPLVWASILASASALLSMFGGLAGGRLVGLYGRKGLSVVGCALAGLASICYVLVPSMWASLGVVLLGTVICGLRYNAISSLSLEQVPEYRGSMMSLNSASMNLGMALGAGIGGYFLLVGDWVLMGVFIGALGLLSAGVLQLWAVDPIAG
jgi:predicted MFS family arabinose efflux permease